MRISRGKKAAIVAGGCFVLIILTGLSQGGKAFTIQGMKGGAQNSQAPSSIWDKAKSFVGLRANDNGEQGIVDQAAQGIFLEKKSLFFRERAKTITNYLINANNAIPINPAALRFAIGQAVLGTYGELADVQKRIDDAKTTIRALTPPAEASVFHALSLELLDLYGRILEKIHTTPRKDVNQSTFAGDLAAIKKTVALERQEARFLTSQFDIPYAPPRVILLYDEAIGL